MWQRLTFGIFGMTWLAFGTVVLNSIDMRLHSRRFTITLEQVSRAGMSHLLIPGAGREYLPDRPNYSYRGRMHAGRNFITQFDTLTILVSGKVMPGENEALALLKDLEMVSNPENHSFILDSSSTNSLASLCFARKTIGDLPIVICSQTEHLERMLWMGRSIGLRCYGFRAEDPPMGYSMAYRIREYLARLKARIIFTRKQAPCTT